MYVDILIECGTCSLRVCCNVTAIRTSMVELENLLGGGGGGGVF